MDLTGGFLGHAAPDGTRGSAALPVARKFRGRNKESLSSQSTDLKCDGCMKWGHVRGTVR